jgi:DNA-binding transcriptional LysR family regulator
LFDDPLVILARPDHPLAKHKPDAVTLAAATHVAVDSLPAFALLERALAERGQLCRPPETVSSVLVGLLLALNSDALLAVPETLSAILEKQFALARIALPFAAPALPVRLLWHSSYDRDECHQWIRGQILSLSERRALPS